MKQSLNSKHYIVCFVCCFSLLVLQKKLNFHLQTYKFAQIFFFWKKLQHKNCKIFFFIANFLNTSIGQNQVWRKNLIFWALVDPLWILTLINLFFVKSGLKIADSSKSTTKDSILLLISKFCKSKTFSRFLSTISLRFFDVDVDISTFLTSQGETSYWTFKDEKLKMTTKIETT